MGAFVVFLEGGESFTWFSEVKKELDVYGAFLSLLELAVDVSSSRVEPCFQVGFALGSVGVVKSPEPIYRCRH